MAFTATQLDALEAAIAQGVRQVRYGDKTAEYQSLDEMLKLRSRMRQQLGLDTSPARRFAKFSKGLA